MSEADGTCCTYRSVKGIQSKIYQIKPEVERDADLAREIRKLVASESFTQNMDTVKLKQAPRDDMSPKPHSARSMHDESVTPSAAHYNKTNHLRTPKTAPRERSLMGSAADHL